MATKETCADMCGQRLDHFDQILNIIWKFSHGSTKNNIGPNVSVVIISHIDKVNPGPDRIRLTAMQDVNGIHVSLDV